MRLRLLVVLPAALACAAPTDSSAVRSRGAALDMTFEEFLASAYREPFEGGVWIVDGDTPVATREGMRDIYERIGTRQRSYGSGAAPAADALSLNTVGGADDRWSDTQKRELTYCVGRASFGSRYDEVVRVMAAAAAAWEAVADVDFHHLAAEDDACDASNPRVLFDVNAVDSGGEYAARAFFPSTERAARNVLVDGSAFGGGGPIDLEGIMRHELGHALGFRHEHTRPESGTCFEDSAHRPLTPYDRESVMHYPQCNGDRTSRFDLTPLDAQGAASVYGEPGGAPAERPDIPAPVREPRPADPWGTPAGEPPSAEEPPPPSRECRGASGGLWAGEVHRYPTLDVPAGRAITVTLEGVGDPDLYAWMRGSAAECASEGPDARERCELVSDGTGLRVDVYGFGDAEYDLRVCW